MNPEFNPVVGDLISVLKNEKENKFRNQESIDWALFMPDSDFIFAQLGPQSFIYVCSKKALDEFEKYIPEAIDRHNHEGLLLANFSPKAMSLLPSNKSWDERRKHILKIIGINFASKYIPMMNQIVDDWIKEVKIGENYDLTGEINKITFRIIAKMLFGRDIDKMDFIEFTTLEDTILKQILC